MMLRRLKEDVEKNLAPKEETIIEVRRLLKAFGSVCRRVFWMGLSSSF